MLAAWLLFPLILAVLTLGVGALVERAAGLELPVALLFPLGFAGLVCVTQLVTWPGATAPAAPYVAVLLALAGFGLSWRRLRAVRLDWWAIAAVAVTCLSFAAPALFTGQPTFLGYQNLGDASIHFEIVDRWMQHGPSLDGLAPSNFRESLNSYYSTSYPTGAHTVLGVGRALTGNDVAWDFQPYLTVLAGLATSGLLVLARSMTSRRWLAAGMAAVTMQAALVYAYAVDQQGIKELATLVSVIALVGVVPPLLARPPGWRIVIPAAVTAAGALGVLSAAAVPFIGPLLVIVLGVLVVRHRHEGLKPVGLAAAGFAAVGFVLALPALARMTQFVDTANGALTAQQEFGNLNGRSLEFVQALGVWPAADFRFPLPSGIGFAYVLIGATGLAIVFGLIAAVRRRAWPVLVFAGLSLLAFVVVSGAASPWAYAKTLMLLSPALLLLGAGAVAAWWDDGRRRVEAGVLALALVAGVGWTNAQAYHGIDAAPNDRLQELSDIGQRYAGQGPAAYFEFEEFAKHFLRQLNPTGVAEPLRPGTLLPTTGRFPRFGFSTEPDDWDARLINDNEKLLVLRQGPTVSRPPSGWKRVEHGRYYDVWKRDTTQPKVLEHLPLGGRFDAASEIPCDQAKRLAAVARAAGGQLAFVPRNPVAVARLTKAPAPANWSVDGGDPDVWRPVGQGRVQVNGVRQQGGRYYVWLEGSVGRAATVYVDGERVGSLVDALNPRLSSSLVGEVQLPTGRSSVRVDVGGGDLDPRNGGRNRYLGPVYLSPVPDLATSPVQMVAPSDYRELCGQLSDWIEAVG